MGHDFSRSERVGAEMQRELALILREGVRDPRLHGVTVQEVRVTRDLSHAKVYFTLMDRTRAREMTAALNRAAGFLRKRLGDVMIMRTIPELHFEYDTSIERGAHLSALIDQAVTADNRGGEDGET
jgi:ribosome-binding factor A